MLSPKNEYINKAVETVYQLSQEEKIRMQCEAREDYYRILRGWQGMLDERDMMPKEQEDMLKEKDCILQKKDDLLKEKDHILTEKDSIIQRQQETLKVASSKYDELLAWAKEHGFES